MTDIAIQMIEPRAIPAAVKLYGSLLARCLHAAGEDDAHSAIADLIIGRRQLWAIFENGAPAAMFRTEIVPDEAGAFLGVSAMAGRGSLKWARAMSETMGRAATEAGCRCVRFFGRKAWGRVIPECRQIGERDGAAVFERAAI